MSDIRRKIDALKFTVSDAHTTQGLSELLASDPAYDVLITGSGNRHRGESVITGDKESIDIVEECFIQGIPELLKMGEECWNRVSAERIEVSHVAPFSLFYFLGKI